MLLLSKAPDSADGFNEKTPARLLYKMYIRLGAKPCVLPFGIMSGVF